MQQDADTDAGADVGWAGREIAELIAEGVGDVLFESIVERIDFLPAFIEQEAAAEHLHSKVILLVDHQGDILFIADADSATTATIGRGSSAVPYGGEAVIAAGVEIG